ncbi:MAG: GntP family permease [Candidatus Hydrogenedentes bacterium]|nr:GntP family permease [Candidatus Hydrogenedentota bacterium]
MFGNLGVILGLALLIFLALRGTNVLLASILSASVVALAHGQSLVTALTFDYSGAMMKFAGMFLLLFLTGAMFGRVIGESKAAMSIAYALSRSLGVERTLLIGTLACALLTYGGVNVFIVVFTVYPLGLGLMVRANIPKRIFMAATMLGAGTFTMTALPGSPSIQNNIPAVALKTSLWAAPGLGLLASLVMIILGLSYIEWERRRAERRGEKFVPAPTDVLPEADPDPATMPHWAISLIPLAAVVGTIVVPQLVRPFLPEVPGGDVSGGDADLGLLGTLVEFARTQPLMWTNVAMVAGTLMALVLLRRFLPRPLSTLSRGAESSLLPLMNTAAVIGFGGVVQATPVYDSIAHVMVDSGLPPLVSAAVSINIVSGIVGSASGGLGIFVQTLAPHYLETGVAPEVLHRVIAIGSGGLDSLPHCGAIITTFTVMGLTHREAYKDTFVVTVLIPLIALVVVLLAAQFA